MSIDSIRTNGGTMSLDVDFTNVDTSDFWSWPWGPKHKYTLSPTEQRYSNVASQDMFYTETAEIDDHKRWHIVKPCLRVALNFRGVYGKFDIIILMTRLTVCSAAFTFAHFLVNHVVAYLYQWTSLNHVHALHTLSVNRETVNDQEFLLEMAAKGAVAEELSPFRK